MELVINKIKAIQNLFEKNYFTVGVLQRDNNCVVSDSSLTQPQELTTIVTIIELFNEHHVYQNATFEEHLSDIDETTGIIRKGRMYFEELRKCSNYVFDWKNKTSLLIRMQKVNFLYKQVMEILKYNHETFFYHILTLNPIICRGKTYYDVLNYLIDHSTINNRCLHTITNLMLLSQSNVLSIDNLYKLLSQTARTIIDNINFDLTPEQINKNISNLITTVSRLIKISRINLRPTKPILIGYLENDLENDIDLINLSLGDDNNFINNIVDNYPLIIYRRLVHIYIFLKACKLWKYEINSGSVENGIAIYYKYIKNIDEVNFDFEYQNKILTKIGNILGRIQIAKEFDLKLN